MTKIARFLGTCLLIGSMATAAWAGETPGTGLPSPAPPAESPTDCPSTLPSVQDASDTTTDVINVLVTWLVESVL